MSELGMRKVQILSRLLQNVKLRRQVHRGQQRSMGDRNYTFGYLFTRRLPHAKVLLVTISFSLYWVDYALEGSPF